MFPTRRITTSGGDVFRDEYSIEFDGSDDYVICGEPMAFHEATAFTVSCWYKPAVVDSYRNIVSKYGNGSNNRPFDLSQNSQKLNFIVRGPSDGATNNVALSDANFFVVNTWYHIAAVYVGGTSITTYVNGVLHKTNTSSIVADLRDDSGSEAEFSIGVRKEEHTTPESYGSGNISNVQLWSAALSSNQIKQLYNGRESFDARNLSKTSLVTKSNLVGWWRMGDGLENGSGTTIYDMSDNANNGALSNHTGVYSGDVPK